MSYLGSLFGFIVMPYIADNYGRKFAEMMAWRLSIFGTVILLVSINL